jgi:hypothetical protein
VLAAASTALLFGAAACGDDDDDDAATTDAPAVTTADAPDTTAATAADPAAFCDAFVAANEAVSTEDPAVIGPAFEAAVAAAPAEIKPAVETVTSVSDDDPAFAAAYGEVTGYVKDSCGFNEVNVTTKDYSFEGVPSDLPAGPAIITMDNQGAEFHEVLLFRVNEGVTDTAIDLLSLPEEEMGEKMSFASATFGPPGEESASIANLTPGRYIAVCFLPQGATPEVMAQMEGPDSSLPEGAGPPHFMAGMVQEITVA